MQPTLIIWDFDWSLVNENSDTFIVNQFHLGRDMKKLYQEDIPWTTIMDTLVLKIQQLGFSADEMAERLCTIPFEREMLDTLDYISLKKKEGQPIDMIIVSDANSFFIDRILESRSARQHFSEIVTNPVTKDNDGFLRVHPLTSRDKHGCISCSENMCKGLIVESLFKEGQRVIYIGDGENDFCPAKKLDGNQNHVLARKGFQLEQKIFPDGIQTTEVTATVHVWKNANQVMNIIKTIL